MLRRPSNRFASKSHRPAMRVESLEGRTLLSAGELDTLFGGSGKATVPFDLGTTNNNEATGVAIQPDGKIVVVGSVQQAGSNNFDFAITRFNPNGSLDTSFDGDGKAIVGFDRGGADEDRATGVAIQPDGKIVVVGSVQISSTGDFDFGIIRLNGDGTLDKSFDSDGQNVISFDRGGRFEDRAAAVALQDNGKIVVVGSVQFSSTDFDFGIARLNADGSRDSSFGASGTTTVFFDLGNGNPNVDRATGVDIQADGKIVVVGSVQSMTDGNIDFAVTRLLGDGTEDVSFSDDGKLTIDFQGGGDNADRANGVAIQPDGKIVIAGEVQRSNAGDFDFGVARINSDGTLDTSFSGDGRAAIGFDLGGEKDDRATGVAIQPDGKIVIAGRVRRLGAGDFDFGVARLTPNGSPDSAFGNAGKTAVAFNVGGDKFDGAAGVAIQRDGKIVVAGTADRSPGNRDFAVARLLATSTLDPKPPGDDTPPPPPPPPPDDTGPIGPDPSDDVIPPPPADRTPPVLVSARSIFTGRGRKRKLTGFALTFSEAINPASAQSGNFLLAILQRKRRGKVTTKAARIVSSSFDPATNTVTILPPKKAKFPQGAQITVLPGITDLAGNALDGDKDGSPGQPATVTVR